jgi:hypothetical protein
VSAGGGRDFARRGGGRWAGSEGTYPPSAFAQGSKREMCEFLWKTAVSNGSLFSRLKSRTGSTTGLGFTIGSPACAPNRRPAQEKVDAVLSGDYFVPRSCGTGSRAPHHGQNRMRQDAVPPSWTMIPYSRNMAEWWIKQSGQSNRSGCCSHTRSASRRISSQQCGLIRIRLLVAEHKPHLPGRDTSQRQRQAGSNTKPITWPGPVQRRVRRLAHREGSARLGHLPRVHSGPFFGSSRLCIPSRNPCRKLPKANPANAPTAPPGECYLGGE